MQKVKKIPQRQCVGCREMKDKRALIRAVKSPQGEVSLDFTGKKPGRGAYVCPNSECLKRARKSRALERALDTDRKSTRLNSSHLDKSRMPSSA